MYCPLINVAFQLKDVPRNSGFVVVPGAHKAAIGPGAWPGPGDSFTMEARQGIGLSIEFESMLQSGHLIQPELNAGDILIFPSAASVYALPALVSCL
jgi:ectoine hydroxylase-related dioxygenase (phytanoyl-CoA dioxygenase family)